MRRTRGFTLVEMIVVVGVIAVLVGLLMPALGGALDTSRKMKDLNRVRQVGLAWTLYAGQNEDRVLPGYLSLATQETWNVTYRYQDGSIIDPSPNDDEQSDPDTSNMFEPDGNITGPWVWRLLPYLDYDYGLVMSHREEEMSALDPVARAVDISNEPAFGYNGVFVGGFWVDGGAWFMSAHSDDDEERRMRVVSTRLGSIRRPADLITFTSSAERGPGVHKYEPGVDDFDGSFIVLPPLWSTDRLWGEPENRDLASLDTVQVGDSEEWFGEFAAFG